MENEEENFEELFNKSVQYVELGKTVTGTVITVTKNNEIYVDLGYKADGIVPYKEYSYKEGEDPHKEFKSGDKITVDILKMNDGTGSILLSYKKVKQRNQKEEIRKRKNEEKQKIEEFWENMQIGDQFNGTVKAISAYGAFVEVARGVQGLLHISDMTWERNANPRDILKEEQEILVRIKEIDRENKRIKLELVDKGENPWSKVQEKYKINDIVKAKITKLMPFGAFAELEPGIEGLIHISQISNKRITKPEEKLSVGQEVNVKILNIDAENKKIELSIRELEGTSYDLEYSEDIKKIENSEVTDTEPEVVENNENINAEKENEIKGEEVTENE